MTTRDNAGQCFVDKQSKRPLPWPDTARTRLAEYLTPMEHDAE